MKKLQLFIPLIFCALCSNAQCLKTLVPLEFQPPNYSLNGANPVPTPSSNYYTFSWTQSQKDSIVDIITFNQWNNYKWTSLPVLKFTFGTGQKVTSLAEYKNRVFVLVRFKAFKGISAPSQKFYSVLEWKGSAWDTLPGSIEDQSDDYASIFGNDHGLYRLKQVGYDRELEKYDFATANWNKLLTMTGPMLYAHASPNRILLTGLSTVNGNACNAFVWLDSNDNIHKPNIPAQDPRKLCMGIDQVTDHIYFGLKGDSVEIFEFDTSVVGDRKTKFPYLIPDPGYIIPVMYVKNGLIAWRFHEKNAHSILIFLCPGQSHWRALPQHTTNHSFRATPFGFFTVSGQTVYQVGDGSRIHGVWFQDRDTNCAIDSGDVRILRRQFVLTSSKIKTAVETDDGGRFEMVIPKGTYSLDGGKYGLSPCMSSSFTLSVNVDTTFNVACRTITKTDLELTDAAPLNIRWNSSRTLEFYMKNHGLECDSAYFVFKLPKYTYSKSAPGIHYDSAMNTVSGKMYNIEKMDHRKFAFHYFHDTSKIKRDSVLCITGKLYSYCEDMDSSDNTVSFCIRVTYPYDPNHKECSEILLPINTVRNLKYFIEFQNEGSDYAQEVVLTDTLTGSLDLESLCVDGASHPFTWTLTGNVLKVVFPNIYLLPKKQNEPLSKGYFKFKINTRGDLQHGTEIKNKVAIDFDLNPSVITNETYSVVSQYGAGLEKIIDANLTFLIYPNPTIDQVSIKNYLNEAMPLSVYSLSGKLIRVTEISPKGTSLINTANWGRGLYLIRCGGQVEKLLLE